MMHPALLKQVITNIIIRLRTASLWQCVLFSFQGFYGRGSLSRHEPIFDRIILTDKKMIQTYLHGVNTDKYVLKQSTRSLADLEEKSEASVRASPRHISHIINADYPAQPLTLIDQQSQFSNNLCFEYTSSSTSDQINHSPLVSDPSRDSLHIDVTTQSEPLQETHQAENSTLANKRETEQDSPQSRMEPSELFTSSVGLLTSQTTDKELVSRTHLQVFSSKQFEHESKGVENEMNELMEQTPEWKEDSDFWFSDYVPETNISRVDSNVSSSHQSNEEHSEEVRYSLPQLDSMKSQTTSIQTTPSKVVEERGGDDYDSDTSGDEEKICLNKLTLSDNIDEEDKSEYLKLNEHLILDTCEAIFLMVSFNCLYLTDDSQVLISVEELWNRALVKDRGFYIKYSVYHHIRSKRWVVKDGLCYGCDFMVYKKGPRYYHSSLGILIRSIDSDTLLDISHLNNRQINWTNIMNVSRVVNNVRKELMIMYVLIPRSVQTSDLTQMSPTNLLKQLKICELLVNRTVPSRERELSSHVNAMNS